MVLPWWIQIPIDWWPPLWTTSTIWGTGGRLSHHFEHHAIPWKTTMLMKNHPFWRNSHLVNILGLISIFIYEIPINHPLLYTTIFFRKITTFFPKKTKNGSISPQKNIKKKITSFLVKKSQPWLPGTGLCCTRDLPHQPRELPGDEQVPGENICPCFVGYPMGYDHIICIYTYIYIYYLFIYLFIYLSM